MSGVRRAARMRHIIRFASSTLAIVVVSACSSMVDGVAVKDPTFKPNDVVTALLNPGNYPTKPQAPLGNGGPNGVILEGHRMADFVVGPWEVDAALLKANIAATLTLKNAAAIGSLLTDPVPSIAAAHNFIVGYSSDRSSEKPLGHLKALSNVVMRFPDPAAAAAAATEMAARQEPPLNSTAPEPFMVPGHPEAQARTWKLGDGTPVVMSFTPHGIYVLHQYARAQESVDVAAQLVTKALDLQAPRIDKFVPTDPAKFADLPIDPTGLYARTLPLPPEEATVHAGVWLPAAALNYQVDPVESKKLFDEAGLEAMSLRKSTVFQVKDAASAQRLADAIIAKGADDKTAPGVPGLRSARCFDHGESSLGLQRYNCVVAVDRYVIDASSKQDIDVQQQTAAQYLMLSSA
jgi:hypothetical protein